MIRLPPGVNLTATRLHYRTLCRSGPMHTQAVPMARAAWAGTMTTPNELPPAGPPAFWQFDPRRHARSLYWRGWGITQIADEFALHGIASDKGGPIPRATIEAWKQRDRWDDAPSIRKIEDRLQLRSAERPAGHAWVRTCRSRCSQYH